MERLSTGIDELDALIQGYPKGKSFLVSGDAGTGKTILALHFLNACCKDGLRCIYIAMEETPEDLKAQAKSFGWGLAEYEEKGLLQIIGVLEQRAEKAEAEADARMPAEMRIEKSYQNLMDILSDIREKGLKCTSLVICDETVANLTDNVMMYSVYGAIKLMKRDNPYVDTRERVMDIVKIRNTKIPLDYLLFDITDKGIVLLPKSETQTQA